MTELASVAVVGAGLMGHGIALALARAGHDVAVTDPDHDARATLHGRVTESLNLCGDDDAVISDTLDRIVVRERIQDAVASVGFVFEAAPEKLALKRKVFAEIETHAPRSAILASNTSVIQIGQIMSGLSSKERALGTHWWNPPFMIPLVEVVKSAWTNTDVATAMFDMLRGAGKKPVMVERDIPGFIGSACPKTPAKPIFVDSISLGSARNSEYRLPNCGFGGGFQVKFRP